MSLAEVALTPDETLCFISHHREGAKGEARHLHTEMIKFLKVDSKMIFIDVDALQDLDQLIRKHVGMTRVLVFLQTKYSLFRPFVLAELYAALLDGIGIVTVEIVGGGYDFKLASEFLGAHDFRERLEETNPGAVGALERQGIDVTQMGEVLNQRIPNLISEKFDMTWHPVLRDAGVKIIAERVLEVALTVPPRKLKPAPISEPEKRAALQRKLEDRGIPSEDSLSYIPRLVREGFTSENILTLATPTVLMRVGITKQAHLRALLSEQAIKEMEAVEESKSVAEEREKLEKVKRELELEKHDIEAAKAEAAAAINAATEEERRALIVKAERLHKEAEEKARKRAVEEDSRLRREIKQQNNASSAISYTKHAVGETRPVSAVAAVLKATFEGHTGSVFAVSFDSSGKLLASGSGDNSIIIWNAESGEKVITFKGRSPSSFSQTGHYDNVKAVCFDPSGGILASASWDATIKLWNVSTGGELKTLTGHTSYVVSVCFDPTGQTLASGSGDKTIKLWDVASGKEIRTFVGHTHNVISACFDPSGRRIASGSRDKTIRIWDVASGRVLQTLKGHTNIVHTVCFDPINGQIVASGSDDTTIRLWEIATGTEIKTLMGHTHGVRSVCFDHSGRILASGSSDTMVKLWDATSGRELNTLSFDNDMVLSVCWNPNGRTLASGSWDNTINLWSIKIFD